MKKTFIVLSLCLILCLAACTKAGGGAEPTAVQQDDSSFVNKFGDGYAKLIETDDAFYYSFMSGYLYYYDKANGVSGVLCSKPECIHDAKKQNNGCNGYIDPTLCSINLIENRLFYLSYDPDARCNALFSINTDGTDRRLVCDLEGLDYLGLGAPQRLDYYRGKLYGYGLYQRVTGAEPEKGLSILCIDPQTGEGQVLYDLRGNYLSASLYYYGQYVYFCTFTVRGPSGSDVEIQRLDTGSLKTETVFSKSGVNGAWFAIKVVSENNIMLIPNALAEGTGQVVYSVTGGELTTAFEFGLQGITYPIEGGALCINRAEKQMEIRTNDGELIYKGDIDTGFLKEIGNNVSIEGESAVYGDTNLLLIVYSIYDPNDPDDDIGTCLVRYDLTQEDPKGELLIYSPWM